MVHGKVTTYVSSDWWGAKWNRSHACCPVTYSWCWLAFGVGIAQCGLGAADWAMRWIGSEATFAERLVAFAAVEVREKTPPFPDSRDETAWRLSGTGAWWLQGSAAARGTFSIVGGATLSWLEACLGGEPLV